MPTSRDPAKRSRQLANLRNAPAAPAGNRRTLVHGAHSEIAIRELRERHVTELAEAFPSASRHEVAIMAHRAAQLELLGAFVDERGVIRHKRRGDIFPAAGFMDRIAQAFERQYALLLDRERIVNGHPSHFDLAQAWAEDDDGDE